jgi:putative transposase
MRIALAFGLMSLCFALFMHVDQHRIVVPSDADGLRRTFADAHRRYTAYINARHRWTGHLWQGRFGAVVMDEEHLAHAMRYVSLNPVRARLVERAEDWRWSSVRAHLAGKDDELVRVAPALERYGAFDSFLGRQKTVTTRGGHCGNRRRAGDRLGAPPGLPSSKPGPAAPSLRKKRGPKPKEKVV